MILLGSEPLVLVQIEMCALQNLAIKNPDPKDPALNCPLRGLPYSFPFAAVCWSGGVME